MPNRCCPFCFRTNPLYRNSIKCKPAFSPNPLPDGQGTLSEFRHIVPEPVGKKLPLKRAVLPLLYHYLTAEETEKFLHPSFLIGKLRIRKPRAFLPDGKEPFPARGMYPVQSPPLVQDHKILSWETIGEVRHHMRQHIVFRADPRKKKAVFRFRKPKEP